MQAVVAAEPGGPDVLALDEVDDAVAGPGEVVVQVAAAGVNRADTLQRRGRYPPPPGASGILGLECSGTVAAVGDGVTEWAVGDQVCALLAGGGYAERVAVPACQLLPVPEGIDLVTAATLPEVAATVWSNVFMVANLQPGEALLVHGGAGGIGSFAIQLASAFDARVFATAGSAEKLALCRELGAEEAFHYAEQDFVAEVRRVTDGAGADVILDNMGASYLARNVAALATSGRLVVIGMQGGARGELDLGALMARRGAVIATALRSRPVAEKAAICAAVQEHVWPLIAGGRIRTMLQRSFPLSEAGAAHALMESGEHSGKIALVVG